jgi:hypothetical protein
LRARAAATRSWIPEDQLLIVAIRVEQEGLRLVARSLGLSHETLRTALVTAGYEALLADAGRKHRLVSAAPPPPPAPAKIPKDRYPEVVTLCQRHPQAEVAALLGVSQTTVWRIARQATRAEGRAGGGPTDA